MTLTFDAIAHQIESYGPALDMRPSDVIASWLPLYHDMGFVATFLLPLQTGIKSVMMSPFAWTAQPLSLFDLIETYKVNYCWMPNFAFNHLASSAQLNGRVRDLSSMKAFINCSEPCKTDTFRRFADAFVDYGVTPEKLHVCYAMAETVFAVSQTSPGSPARLLNLSSGALQQRGVLEPGQGEDSLEVLSTGKPIEGIEVRIAGGDVGEIEVSGHFVFSGYHRSPQLDAEVLERGWYRTGDIGFLAEGELYVLGRKKDLIIVYGKNFFAHEIEALVGSVEGVKPGRVGSRRLAYTTTWSAARRLWSSRKAPTPLILQACAPESSEAWKA